MAATVAITITALVGFGALGVETGLWFSDKRHYQTAADAAAISGAFQLANAKSLTVIQAAGSAEATSNGFIPSSSCGATPTNDLCVTEGNWNGTSYTANGAPFNAVRAVITAQKNTLLAALFLPSVTIGTSAIAVVDTSFGHGCITALGSGNANNSNNAGVNIAGSTSVNLGKNCSIVSDWTGSFAINDQGGSGNNLTAYDLYAVGSVNFTGQPSFQPAPGQVPLSGQAPITDPYSSSCTGSGCDVLPAPPVASGSNQNSSIPSKSSSCPTSGAVKLSAGQYTSGMNLSICGSYTLAAGTYYVSGGDFVVSNASVTGTGVTIVLTSGKANNTSSIQIGSNATGSLIEPSSGTYSGILFYQYTSSGGKIGSITNCNSPANSINANGGVQLEGTIYTPSQPLCFQGTPTTMAGSCLQLFALQLSIQGNPSFDDTGCPSGTTGNNITNVVLVE